MKSFNVGDKVIVVGDYARGTSVGQVFEVQERPKGANSVNYKVVNLRTLRVSKGPAEAFDLAPDLAVAVLADYEAPEPLVAGQLVTISGSGWNGSTTELYVVLDAKRDGKYKITKLGGMDGKYYASIARSSLTPAEIPASLVS